ncbi:hypothetical protein [Gracilimonas sp.]|uniref:hypothetical protein n=1 Tax=Gracilimonas sp. TaxID=1974203 RepID=UPI0028720D42|nr:hypothetical protein [Gracilimonas sp.]
MNTQNKTDREVEKTMQSLDGFQPAKTDPFFYSRLSAKLENREETELEGSFNYGFAFSMAAVVVFLFLNVISLSMYQNIIPDEPATEQEIVEELTYEYQALDLSYYQTFEEE